MKARSRLQPDKPSEDLTWWDSGIRRLSLCLRFSPTQSQSSSFSKTIKATCSFLQMTSFLNSVFVTLFVTLNTKTALQISVVPFSAVRGGFEPPVHLRVRQFSKLVVSATHPSHLKLPIFSNRTAKIQRIYCFATIWFHCPRTFSI